MTFVGTPASAPSLRKFIALVRSSIAIKSPRFAARGDRAFLRASAALQPPQVPSPFSVVHVPVVDFVESIPGSDAATLFDRLCSVHSCCWHPLPPAANGQAVWETVPAHGIKRSDKRRLIPQPGSRLQACRQGSIARVPC
jgi:hypothetical protein